MKVLRSVLYALVGLSAATATVLADPSPIAPKAAPKEITLAQNTAPATEPAPGVYEAAPFAGTVLVPAEMDAHFVIGKKGAKHSSSMPMAKPQLRLIPREKKQ